MIHGLYFGAIIHETVHIVLTMVMPDVTAVFLNAYVMAPIKQNVWTTLDSKFGHNAGKTTIIISELYRPKTVVAFTADLAACMQELGYESYPVEDDLWVKLNIKCGNGLC